MGRTIIKYPDGANGRPFSDDLVGFQVVQGGGLTQGNFQFTTNITEKVNREFNIGSFSEPITLDTLNISNVLESKAIIAKEFRVYPNFDLSEITKFNLYGPLSKRFSTSIQKIINYFPAALEVYNLNSDFKRDNTAIDISYDNIEHVTSFKIDVTKFTNPFGIDYSVSASRNISLKEYEVSPLRNLTVEYNKFSLFIGDDEYPIYHFTPSDSLYTGTTQFVVFGQPFSGQIETIETLVIRPNTFYTDKSLVEPFDEVEKFLLNRLVVPKYTATFQVPKMTDEGVMFNSNVNVTWPIDGVWNLDIRTRLFDNYLNSLNDIAVAFDESKTNLITRFLTTESFKEFDTEDQRVQKILSIYGRSFDEVKKFIDGLAYMNSVNYTVKNDIPSQLLKNLAETVGWKTNVSPVTNEDFLDSIFGNNSKIEFQGYSRSSTPTELNYQFYRNLILNSAYLFKSKGTRKSIEFLLRLIGAPEALIEFNENIYIAGQKINMADFDMKYAQISGGTYVEEFPVFDTTTFTIYGNLYSAFTTQEIVTDVDVTLADFPVDSYGYPKSPEDTQDYFFQKGAGWFELVKDHQSPQKVNYTNSVFTGQNFNIQTEFEQFTYGQKYLDRYRYFPYLNTGYRLLRIPDNKKSWPVTDTGLRVGNGSSKYDAYYFVDNEKLVLNVKNVDLFLNPAQGLVYDVWYMSRKYDYPIPSTGLTSPYPQPGGIDSTFINPQPSKKSFFEFAQTFWNNMINVRDRQFSSDGKTSGYLTLQSIFWNYLQSEQTIGIPNDNFNYRAMMDYVNGMGDYWMRLVEQMIPATTIWLAGVKYENSIFHRQKFVYRIQRGCAILPVPCVPCTLNGNLFLYNCIDETIECPIYPWDGGSSTVQSFQDILNQTVTNYVISNSLTCDLNSLVTDWYIDLRLDSTILLQQKFFTGYGTLQTPTNSQWSGAVQTYVTNLTDADLTYFLSGNTLYVSNSGCEPKFINKQIQLNVGLNFTISCS
jgi:hypothetical protein